MDQLAPEVREALIAIQKDLFLNISIHQFLVAKVEQSTNGFDKNDLLEHKNDIECKIKILDQKQKKLLAVVRRAGQSKEEKISITSPDKKKLIDYGGKRPYHDDGACPEPLKKRRVSKKLDVGSKGRGTKKNRRDSCFTEQEEATLRALGCFYVFSHQQQLTRPLTEQDYFLMNFGLVSRDHIQYAPHGFATNVRRTRRQLGNKPKYKSSEWETIEDTKKTSKLLKGKPRDEEKSSFTGEVCPNVTVQKGDVFIVTGDVYNVISNPSIPNATSNANIPNVISNTNVPNVFSNTNSPNVISNTNIPNVILNTNIPNVISNPNSPNGSGSVPLKARSLLNFKNDEKPKNHSLVVKEEDNSTNVSSSMTVVDSSIPSEGTETETMVKKEEEVKTESEEVVALAQEITRINEPTEPQSEPKSNAEIIPGNTLSSDEISEESSLKQISSESTLSVGKSLCDNSSDHLDLPSLKDSVPSNEPISSQDSGISVHSNSSETAITSLCPITGYSTVISQDLVGDENDSSDESLSHETELLLPGPVLREHTEITVECK